MALTLSAMAEAHKRQLGDANQKFSPEDFQRHVLQATKDMETKRPLIKTATLPLVAGQTGYVAPADMVRPYAVSTWGGSSRRDYKPYEQGYAAKLPKARLLGNDLIELYPPPTAAQISQFGDSYPLRYMARHVLSDTGSETTIPEHDQPVLLLRALIIAMRTLASLNITNPINLNRGLNPSPPETTPQALYSALQREWDAL